MKVINLTESSGLYTSNVYLVTGTWNRLSDLNTLIDVGRDPIVIETILHKAATGVGKHKVEQVVITHNHYDHTEILPKIIEVFHPKVYAYSSSLAGVDQQLFDEESLFIGDRTFQVFHAPGHSSDSIFIYNEEEGVLFAGDNPLMIIGNENEYHEQFLKVLMMLGRKRLEKIYPGHGKPISHGALEIIKHSLRSEEKR